jgi:geranylgeranyl pyrophosphate synthase
MPNAIQTPTHTINARNAIADAQALLREDLAQVEHHLRALPGLQPESLRHAVEIIVASGGKRIRPIITLLVAGMMGYAKSPRLIYLASAAEMLHTSSLVHDDLIDGSLVRRGAATLNAVWTPAATVLTGDYLFSYAAGLAAKTDSVRVMSIFADTLGVIVGGELQQQFTDFAQRSTRPDYYRRIYAKTGSLFVLATTAAGVLTGATEAQIAALGDYGRALGDAFQIVDDILDFTGDQASVGKPVGSDLRRGLITLPTIYYKEQIPADPDLDCALKGECEPEAYDRLIHNIRHSEAIRAAINEATGMATKAKLALSEFPHNAYRDALMAVADYTVSRTT